jgi:glycosyltransferase involved in cell wall biosynthesis
MPDRHWKWRMHGSALTFAERHKEDIQQYDLVIVTDLCDVASLKGLLKIDVPVILYFHENQLAYPWSPTDDDTRLNRDRHYMWINFISAMAADHLWFNSEYNLKSFFDALPGFLRAFPDHRNYDLMNLKERSKVVPLGLDLKPIIDMDKKKQMNEVPLILWNHRWEYDKNPDLFFNSMFKLYKEQLDFKLVILGEKSAKYPKIFEEVKTKLNEKIIHMGYCQSREEYLNYLSQSDIALVTNDQDFFGISVVEAIAAGITPLLPAGKVYSEHISPEKYPELYYQSDEELSVKLKALINNRIIYNLCEEVSEYDWTEMISEYDEALWATTNLNL